MKFVVTLCLIFVASGYAFHFDQSLCGNEASYPCTRDLRTYCFGDGTTQEGCIGAYNYLCLHPAVTYGTC